MVEGPEIAGIFTLIVPCIVFVVYVFIIALVIICLFRVMKYLEASGKEQKLIRMELSKVAEEVHLMRERLERSDEREEPESEEQT
jgi:uncharacterized membrane protein